MSEQFHERVGKKTDWEILGVPEGASPAEIKTAYRVAIKKTHPDAKSDKADDTSVKEVIEAYKRLSGLEKRPIGPAAEAARKYKAAQDLSEVRDPNDPDQADGLWG
jgi:DnaJ-class molecular chaperone